jgi:hypothetical protein
MFGASTNYVDYVVPYVASFDREFVLGLKKKGDDPFHKTWTQVRAFFRACVTSLNSR